MNKNIVYYICWILLISFDLYMDGNVLGVVGNNWDLIKW